MPTSADFDALLESVPESPGMYIGYPGRINARVDSGNSEFRFGHSKMGVQSHKFLGTMTLDSTESMRQGLFGLPIQVYDNPLGTIPSTLFTPTAAKIPGINPELLELALLAKIVIGFYFG